MMEHTQFFHHMLLDSNSEPSTNPNSQLEVESFYDRGMCLGGGCGWCGYTRVRDFPTFNPDANPVYSIHDRLIQ